jgi:N-acetylmuramoyl-L-alanine amidase
VTRRADGSFQKEPYDFTGDGRVRSEGQALEDGAERIQSRIDWANDFGAEILVSVHFNGSDDPSVSGTEVYWSDFVPEAAQNRALADALRRHLLTAMREAGHPARDRGIHDDIFERATAAQRARSLAHNQAAIVANGFDPRDCRDCRRLLVLGKNPMSKVMGSYVGALVEVEYLSNPNVVEGFLLREDSVEIIARGLRDGIVAFVEGR